MQTFVFWAILCLLLVMLPLVTGGPHLTPRVSILLGVCGLIFSWAIIPNLLVLVIAPLSLIFLGAGCVAGVIGYLRKVD